MVITPKITLNRLSKHAPICCFTFSLEPIVKKKKKFMTEIGKKIEYSCSWFGLTKIKNTV